MFLLGCMDCVSFALLHTFFIFPSPFLELYVLLEVYCAKGHNCE